MNTNISNRGFTNFSARDIVAAQNAALQKAFVLLGGAVLTAVVTSYMLMTSMQISSGMSLFASLAVFAAAFFVPNLGDTPAGYAGVIGTGALLGVAVTPMVAYYISVGAALVVLNALVATGAIFLSMALVALTSKKDFSNMGGFLFAAILGAVVLGLVNMFFLKSAMVSLVLSYLVALVSAALILWRINTAVKNGVYSAVALSFGLLIDVYNLFVSLLQIFGNRE